MLHSDPDEEEDSEKAPLLEERRTHSEPNLKRATRRRFLTVFYSEDHWSITSLSPLGMTGGSFDDIHELTLISVTGPMGVA